MFKKIIALLLIITFVYWSFSALMPQQVSSINTAKNAFSTERALQHLKIMSKSPHYLGSKAHTDVKNYIVSQLQKLGLQTQIQEGYSISEWGNLSKPQNILARIKGHQSGKALLLLTHYDSSPYSSYGASDAGSGVATILEAVRAFLSSNKIPANDIIILISDAEELGLNGADIFVNQHPWAKDVGLVLNFEARGSGGPSYMLIETNGGNEHLMKGFVAAKPEYPVANSLAYSIYKMLPNDTDLTRFREDGNIEGFNFAFIDDHFDYHAALDTYARLDRKSLEHQGHYIMPLLNYFSEVNLNNLKSDTDYSYFTVPFFKTVMYPFSWGFPMLIIAVIIFIGLLRYGLTNKWLVLTDVKNGFTAFFSALFLSGGIGFLLWKLIYFVYPQYAEILQGFTYNGHIYIMAFVCITLAICFYTYRKTYKADNGASLLVAPLFFWLIICTIVAFTLKGANFFIIPVYFGLLSLLILMKQKKPNVVLLALLAFPLIAITTPLIKMFPVGLGLKILFIACILTALIFGLLVSVFSFFKHKKRWVYICSIFGIGLLINAHANSNFTKNTPKPNSLVYLLDADNNTALWATYDNILDRWTTPFLTKEPNKASLESNIFGSKYYSGFSYTQQAPLKKIPKSKIAVTLDTIIGNNRHVEICLIPQRIVNRIEVFSDTTAIFNAFTINGVEVPFNPEKETVFSNRQGNRLFSYYLSDNEPLDMMITFPKEQSTNFIFYEASYDLLENKLFNVPPRNDDMIPKPFVLNDAVIVKSTLTIN